MNGNLCVASLLGAALLFGIVQTARDGHAWRRLRIALQVAAAMLLFLCLFPPSTREHFVSGELVVLTPGATRARLDATHAAADVIALPGVDATRDVERAPDLATALRRHAEARSLRIVGGGLPLRDRDAARGLVSAFDAAAQSPGITEVDAPRVVQAGHAWRVSGRVEGIAQARVELHDPGGALVASATPDAQGRFALDAQAKGEGTAVFTLRVQEREGQRVDEVPLPIVVQAGAPLTLLLLAGAPDAELKYLRRWAADAGIRVDSRLALSEGVALTEGDALLDADALRKADVAIVDERAWVSFGAAQKAALIAAVKDGLGLLLRVTGPLSADVASDWAALGFRVQAQDTSVSAPPNVALDRTLGLTDSAQLFARRAIDVQAPDAAALLRADDGTPLALWRNETRGRVGLWWLADAFRLGLAGERARYASLWSDTLTTLARARGAAMPQIPREARVDERVVVCGVATGDQVESPRRAVAPLLVDVAPSSTDRRGCAAYWPMQAGWHTLISAGERWPFHVRASDEAMALARAEIARATRTLIGDASVHGEAASRPLALPRWPFFLFWLATSGLLWWLERRVRRA
jgi:hypothetical protein